MKAHECANRPPDRVFNQPPLLENSTLFAHDPLLCEALGREGGEWAEALAHPSIAIAIGPYWITKPAPLSSPKRLGTLPAGTSVDAILE